MTVLSAKCTNQLQSLIGVLRKGRIWLEQGWFGAWWKNKPGVILQFAFFLNYTIVHGIVLAQERKEVLLSLDDIWSQC